MDCIIKYFPQLTPTQIEQFRQLGELYPEWNEKINVISRKDIENLYPNHILHSLGISKMINFSDGSRVLDMGTGGGFPGIPLAILFPNVQFHLVDRIAKKIRVATDIAQRIGLTNVTLQQGDIGEVRDKYDFVVSRAVMLLEELVPLIRKNISKEQRNGLPNGLICLKGGDLVNEIKVTKLPSLVTKLSDYFDEDFFKTKHVVYVQI